MRKSASQGLTSGVQKRKRDNVSPADLQAIFKLWNLNRPRDVEHVFALTLMTRLGPRGGEELQDMHWGQFSREYNREVGFYYN